MNTPDDTPPSSQAPPSETTLATRHPHPRDVRIRFDPAPHEYYIDGHNTGIVSVTTFIHDFFPKFDPDAVIKRMMQSPKWCDSPYHGMSPQAIKDKWESNRTEQAALGTQLHTLIDRFYNGTLSEAQLRTHADTIPELHHFLRFHHDFKDDLEPYRTEWCIFDDHLRLAGSVDMVFRQRTTGRFFIYDWKRTKELKYTNRWETGLDPLDHRPHCNYISYSMQLYMYRYILEKHYGLKISATYLCIFHPNNPSYLRVRGFSEVRKDVKRLLALRQSSLTS